MHKEELVHKVRRVPKAHRELGQRLLDRRGQLVLKEREVRKAQQVLKVLQELKERQAHKEPPGHKVLLVRKELLVRRAQQAHRARLEHKEQVELRAQPEQVIWLEVEFNYLLLMQEILLSPQIIVRLTPKQR